MARSTKRRRWLSWRGRATDSLLVPQRARRVIEACVATFFRVIEGRFLIYDFDLHVGLEKFVLAKRRMGAVNATEVERFAGLFEPSRQGSYCPASERLY